MAFPWVQEKWLPGVLSQRQIETLIRQEFLENFTGDSDPSAIDLHLTDEGYELFRGSVKPFGDRYAAFLKDKELSRRLERDGDGYFKLEKKKCYVFRLKEKINFPKQDHHFFGQATARSSIGRMDVMARLIVDGMYQYESFNSSLASSNSLFIEIIPLSFNVRVRMGSSLSQLRIFYCSPEASELNIDQISNFLLHGGSHNDGTLSVDLSNVTVKGMKACAFSIKKDFKNEADYLDLFEKGRYDPGEYWDLMPSLRFNGVNRLEIEKERFYILRSKETISLPKGVAVYCRAMDETLGEMRIHYAGFVHPGFGMQRVDNSIGTPLIFEVRGHDVNVNLADSEKLARLTFYRMSEESEIATDKTQDPKYLNQSLTLSSIFKDWE